MCEAPRRTSFDMKGSGSEKTERLGIQAVSTAFIEIDWAVLENTGHDIGTDLLLLARDEAMFELGVYIGAQVKSGASWFREKYREDGAVKGWWFRDKDGSHLNAWAAFPLPHLLILHDPDTKKTHWVRVTPDQVISTGKGAKILVPAANTVDEAHRGDLLAVARTVSDNVDWQGSAWTLGRAIAADDLLRHALIVPRLIAPHPNSGTEKPVGPAEVLALAAQARLRDLHRFSEVYAEVPSADEMLASPDWSWRLAGALIASLTGQSADALRQVARETPDAPVRSAATVAAVTALVADGHASVALDLVDEALAQDDAAPVDHAWLTAQRARLLLELGDGDLARAAAVSVQPIRQKAPTDVTAAAIAGSAAILLFNSSDWQGQQLGELDPDGAADRVLDLLAQDSHHRQWAAHVATRMGQQTDVGILSALIEDSDVSVRAVAAAGLASLVAAGQGGALAMTGLRRSAAESGVLVPLNVADVLSRAETLTAEAEPVLDDLRNHPSARVRFRANGDVEL
jgi:Domain of unknown function (DUF4365)